MSYTSKISTGPFSDNAPPGDGIWISYEIVQTFENKSTIYEFLHRLCEGTRKALRLLGNMTNVILERWSEACHPLLHGPLFVSLVLTGILVNTNILILTRWFSVYCLLTCLAISIGCITLVFFRFRSFLGAQSSRQNPLINAQDLEKAPEIETTGQVATVTEQSNYHLYTLVLLSDLRSQDSSDILEKLERINRLPQVLTLLELQDESLELVILRSSLPTLEYELKQVALDCKVMLDYDPTQPSPEDVKYCFLRTRGSTANSGEMVMLSDKDTAHFYNQARHLKVDAFLRRVDETIVRPGARGYYAHLRDTIKDSLDHLSMSVGDEAGGEFFFLV